MLMVTLTVLVVVTFDPKLNSSEIKLRHAVFQQTTLALGLTKIRRNLNYIASFAGTRSILW